MRVTGLNPTDELLSFDVYQVLAPKMETTLSVGVILTAPSVACAVFPPTMDIMAPRDTHFASHSRSETP